MEIIIKNKFNKDFKTRPAGERLRNLIIDSLEKEESIVLDFEGITIASVSFFDEGFAKLKKEKLSKKKLNLITLKNLFRRDLEVLKSVCDDRKLPLENINVSIRNDGTES